MIKTLKILKQAGFFKQYSDLTDEEILARIYEDRKRECSKFFEYDYDPRKNLSDQELASRDNSKVLHLDLEADVCKENKVYSWLLKKLNDLSGRENLITDVFEEWESETGPIKIRYNLDGDTKVSLPAYLDDWVDQNFIEEVLQEISKVINEPFHLCLGPDQEWFGQDVNYMRLTSQQRKLLEEKLHWMFFDDFLKQIK